MLARGLVRFRVISLKFRVTGEWSVSLFRKEVGGGGGSQEPIEGPLLLGTLALLGAGK